MQLKRSDVLTVIAAILAAGCLIGGMAGDGRSAFLGLLSGLLVAATCWMRYRRPA